MKDKKKVEDSPLTVDERVKTHELFTESCQYISMIHGKKPAHLFYTHFIQALKYSETKSMAVPLAGVGFAPDSPSGVFVVNPRNAKNLNLRQFAGMVVHEIGHVILSHLFAEEIKDPRFRKLVNIAMDAEVNQIVLRDGYELPGGKGILEHDPDFEVKMILPESLAETFQVDPPELDRDWQYYFNWLLDQIKDAKDRRDKANSDGQSEQGERSWIDDLIDDLYNQTQHDLWEDSGLSPEEQQIVERKVAQAASEAMAQSGGAPGNMAGSIMKLVKRLKPEVPWTRHVNEFLGGVGEVGGYVKRRFNKRDLLGQLSFKPEKAVGLVLDTSGSVTDQEYGKMLAEALALSQVHNLDVVVQETSYGEAAKMWRLSDQSIKEFYERNGYGGTNMKPGIEAFLREWDEGGEFQVGGIIVMSDGELGDNSRITPEECDLPLIWLFTRKHNPFEGKRHAGSIIYTN